MELRSFQTVPPIAVKLKDRLNQSWFRPAQRRRRTKPAPAISIIIPAHNEEAYLPRTLDALQRQNYPRFEIIVVANGCTDATADVARGRCHRLIVLSQKSLGVARNLGARMAKGELLIFLDADTELEPMTLRITGERFLPNYAAATVKGRPDTPALPYRALYGLKNIMHQTGLHTGSSGVIICWKKDFLKIGGFDEALEVRENSELIWRLKRSGQYMFIREVTATTSMRRYEQVGFNRMIRLWIKVWFQTRFGDLHRRHYDAVR